MLVRIQSGTDILLSFTHPRREMLWESWNHKFKIFKIKKHSLIPSVIMISVMSHLFLPDKEKCFRIFLRTVYRRRASRGIIVAEVHVVRIVPLTACDEQSARREVKPYHLSATWFALTFVAQLSPQMAVGTCSGRISRAIERFLGSTPKTIPIFNFSKKKNSSSVVVQGWWFILLYQKAVNVHCVL